MAKSKSYYPDWGYYTLLFHAPMETVLWKELTAHDVFVFTELLGQRKQGKFDKPDTFIITPGMMKGRISGPTFYKAISNLIQRGFVEILEHGGVGTEGEHRANVYILSLKWQEVINQRQTEPGFLLPRLRAPGYRLRPKK